MRDREIDLQDAAIADLSRIEGDLHRLGVPGPAGADRLVLCGVLGAAGIARDSVGHTVDMLEHTLHAPETAASDNRDLGARTGRLIDRRRRDHAPTLRRGSRRPKCRARHQDERYDGDYPRKEPAGGGWHRRSPAMTAEFAVANIWSRRGGFHFTAARAAHPAGFSRGG